MQALKNQANSDWGRLNICIRPPYTHMCTCALVQMQKHIYNTHAQTRINDGAWVHFTDWASSPSPRAHSIFLADAEDLEMQTGSQKANAKRFWRLFDLICIRSPWHITSFSSASVHSLGQDSELPWWLGLDKVSRMLIRQDWMPPGLPVAICCPWISISLLDQFLPASASFPISSCSCLHSVQATLPALCFTATVLGVAGHFGSASI